MTRPLEKGRVESGWVEARTPAEVVSEYIDVSEKEYFEVNEQAVTTTKDTWLTGQINTMTKSTNSGYAYLTDGTRVFFRITAENPGLYYGLFAHNGLVKMHCVAHLDENLRPLELEVSDMVPLQPDLF